MHGEGSQAGTTDRLSAGSNSAVAAHQAAMASLKGEQAQVTSEIEKLKQQQQALSAELSAVSAADRKTQLDGTKLEAASAVDIPRVKCAHFPSTFS